MTCFEDTRVDICLYFIAPHALLPADIAAIERLGKMVPIVPIISKVPVLAPNTLQCKSYSVQLCVLGGLSLCRPEDCPLEFLVLIAVNQNERPA